MFTKTISILLLSFISGIIIAQSTDPFKPDVNLPAAGPGFELVWHDEFNTDGKPDPANWIYENGFARNQELHWYQPENATCVNGLLVITAKREQVKNPGYTAGSTDWRKSREYAGYTSASIQTRGLRQWQYGRFEIRARIDTTKGAWPAIWTLGVKGRWPTNGEVDILEFYRVQGVPTILANIAWGTDKPNIAKWDDARVPLTNFTSKDPDWVKKFHVWRMDWSKDSVSLLLDDMIINTTALDQCINADGSNPLMQPHFLLLNLAIGGNGDDPTFSAFPIKYEVDYVRVYQKNR